MAEIGNLRLYMYIWHYGRPGYDTAGYTAGYIFSGYSEI